MSEIKWREYIERINCKRYVYLEWVFTRYIYFKAKIY